MDGGPGPGTLSPLSIQCDAIATNDAGKFKEPSFNSFYKLFMTGFRGNNNYYYLSNVTSNVIIECRILLLIIMFLNLDAKRNNVLFMS